MGLDHGQPPVGSRAWEARLEVEKLPRVIQERVDAILRGDMSEAEHARALADIANLADELHHHEGVLDRLELEPGKGFIAARRRPEFTEILEM